MALRHLIPMVGIAAACGGDAARSNPSIALTDDLGALVSLSAPARRVVSLAPSHTDLLFSIGAGDRVVGRTRWATWPPEALAVPSIGEGLDPNVEAIAGTEPDLVVAYASSANATAMRQLGVLGIPTFNLRTDRLDDVARGARAFGRLTGLAHRADSIAGAFTVRLDSARRAAGAAPPRLRVLLLAWEQPPIVIGGGSFQSEVVRLAGAENVFHDLDQPSAQVTIETIVARDPDVVVRLGSAGEPAWARRPEWQAVRAVRERRFVGVEGLEFEHPSFRVFEGVRRLRAALDRVVD